MNKLDSSDFGLSLLRIVRIFSGFVFGHPVLIILPTSCICLDFLLKRANSVIIFCVFAIREGNVVHNENAHSLHSLSLFLQVQRAIAEEHHIHTGVRSTRSKEREISMSHRTLPPLISSYPPLDTAPDAISKGESTKHN